MKTIAVNDGTKAQFDAFQRLLAVHLKGSVSQDFTLHYLLANVHIVEVTRNEWSFTG